MKTSTALTTSAVAVVLATALVTPGVHAHGGMVSPKPRALTTMGLSIDTTFGFPIPMRADYTHGKGGDCINFTPDTNLQPLPLGTSKIKMRANNGANHVGPCSVFLVNPQSPTDRLQVGQMDDCMRSLVPGPGPKGAEPTPAEMTINVPSGAKLPCSQNGHCVLQFVWEARHNIPIENYNNCADVQIAGAGGNDESPATSAPVTSTRPTVTPKPSATPYVTSKPAPSNPTVAPQPTPKPTTAEPSAPDADGNKDKYVGTTPGMTQWCNWNCPHFCPSDLCKEA